MKGFNRCKICRGTQFNQGFTLVELMVSIVISLVILGGVVQSVIASKSTYTLQEELARMQENGRFALDILASDIRMAGYSGCGGSAKVTNVLKNSSAWFNGYEDILGLEGGVDTFPSDLTDNLAEQDALYVMRGDTDNRFKVTDYNANSAVVDIVGTHTIDPGTIMTIADPSCKTVGIFQVTGGNPGKFGHNTGNSETPGNCTKNLTFGGTCSDSYSGSGETFPPGSSVMTMSLRAFFLSDNTAGVPSLYMKEGVADKIELIEGIEGLQLTYGVDADADGEIDIFQAANTVVNWDNVKSARLELLMRSINKVGSANSTINFNGVDTNYNDNYARQVVSSTVMLRNR